MEDKIFVLVYYLKSMGVNFGERVEMLTQGQLAFYADLAKEWGYKKPANYSTGYGFYMKLQKEAKVLAQPDHNSDFFSQCKLELNIHRALGK